MEAGRVELPSENPSTQGATGVVCDWFSRPDGSQTTQPDGSRIRHAGAMRRLPRSRSPRQ